MPDRLTPRQRLCSKCGRPIGPAEAFRYESARVVGETRDLGRQHLVCPPPGGSAGGQKA